MRLWVDMNFRGSLIQTTAACEQVCKTRVWTERLHGHPQATCPLHPAAWGPWSCLWPPSWPLSLARAAYLALANERGGHDLGERRCLCDGPAVLTRPPMSVSSAGWAATWTLSCFVKDTRTHLCPRLDLPDLQTDL